MPAVTKKSFLGMKGPFGLYLFLVTVPVLALQGMVYLQIVDQTVGAFPIMKRLRMLGDRAIQEPKVAVLRSDINAGYSGPKPEYYYDLSAFWDFQAQAADFEHRVIKDDDLAQGLGTTATVLVLPWVTCLTQEQKQSIRDFLNKGGSVIATGPLGARNEKNEWSGWEFLTELTGLTQIVSITPEDKSYASFRGNQFYSATVPAGLLLDLPKHVLTVGMGQSPDIYWSDEKWHPVSVDWPSEAAIGTHGVYGKGRVVWLGFNERLSGNNAIRQYMDNYIRAAIQWAGRQPLAVPALWPDKKAMAAIPMGDFGEDFRAAQEVADLFRQEQMPATFFCESRGAMRTPASTDMLRRTVELATTGDAPEAFTGQSLIRQVDRLKKAKVDLDRPAFPVLGFKAPDDALAGETVMALRTAGYSYFVDSAGGQRAVPELMEFRASSVWGRRVELARISTPWSDDAAVVADYEGPTPWKNDLGDAFLREFELAQYLGGVYTFGFRGALLGAKDNRELLMATLRRMKQKKDAWFTSGRDLTAWWSRRNKIRVETIQVHQHRVRVSVTNRGNEDMNSFIVDVHLPQRPKKVRILSEILGKTPPQFELLPEEEVLRLEFQKLKRGSSQVFLVALDES